MTVGNERPALKLLNRYVRTGVSGKWHDLGLELLEQEDEEKLNEIESNNPSDTNKCCTKMFQWWLDKYADKATWNQLIKALREVELSSLATRIEKMLTPLRHSVCVSTGLLGTYVNGNIYPVRRGVTAGAAEKHCVA